MVRWVGCIKPQIRPVAGKRAVEEGADALIDVLAQLAHRALADPRQWDNVEVNRVTTSR